MREPIRVARNAVRAIARFFCNSRKGNQKGSSFPIEMVSACRDRAGKEPPMNKTPTKGLDAALCLHRQNPALALKRLLKAPLLTV